MLVLKSDLRITRFLLQLVNVGKIEFSFSLAKTRKHRRRRWKIYVFKEGIRRLVRITRKERFDQQLLFFEMANNSRNRSNTLSYPYIRKSLKYLIYEV